MIHVKKKYNHKLSQIYVIAVNPYTALFYKMILYERSYLFILRYVIIMIVTQILIRCFIKIFA